jgi:hypothetical protein
VDFETWSIVMHGIESVAILLIVIRMRSHEKARS